MSDFDTLQLEVDRVAGLINETNNLLDEPVSHMRKDFENSISKSAPKIAARLGVLTSKGRIEEAVIGGAILGIGWVGATAIDGIKNAQASSQMRQTLIKYYQELAVKQTFIVEAQQNLILELKNNINGLESEREDICNKLLQFADIIKRMGEAQEKRTV